MLFHTIEFHTIERQRIVLPNTMHTIFYGGKLIMILKQLFNNKKKAFTLIELLIVIAIIGILFIVLVSKVDFATDKAKASGVQTDFRSFQMAFDTVAKENAGFASFGWDTGDENGDRIRNSYDKGDNGAGGGIAHNGIQDGSEVFVGSKEYGETWNEVFTLVNPDDNTDTSGFVALENAINANLDPKLHITITPDVDGTALTGNATITMANQARDPWKNEYHGVYITNAVRDDGADRGAIVMYSDGANGKWGSAHDITNGVVTITVPGNNVNGKDDYSFVSCYTFVNGYGEVLNSTTGFSNNQSFLTNGGSTTPSVVPGGNLNNNNSLTEIGLGGTYTFKSSYDVETVYSIALQSKSISVDDDGMATCPLVTNGSNGLVIRGYEPSQVDDTYMIVSAMDDKAYGYLSQGMIDWFTDLGAPFEFDGPGWYIEDANGLTKANEIPQITLYLESDVHVDNLNILLPLFEGGSSGSASNGGNTPVTPLERYSLTGNGQTFYDGTSTSLVFSTDADPAIFEGIKINGGPLDASYYTVTPGTTTVTLHQSFCEMIPATSYDIEFVYADGSAKGVFYVNRDDLIANNTGVKTNVTIKVGSWNPRVYETTDCKTLYDLAEVYNSENSSIASRDEYYINDYDNSFLYIDSNGILRKLTDVPIESNTTYTFLYVNFDSYYWKQQLNSNGSLDTVKYGGYSIINVDLSALYDEGQSKSMMPTICRYNATYKDALAGYYPVWWWFVDLAVFAQNNGTGYNRQLYQDTFFIYPAGSQAGSEQTSHLITYFTKNNQPIALSQSIIPNDTVVLGWITADSSVSIDDIKAEINALIP